MYGTSPVGNKSLASRNPHRRMMEFLETTVQFLEVLPSIVQFQQADILMDGFLWSRETYEVIRKAAEDVYKIIHEEEAPWIQYGKTNSKRASEET